MHTSAIQTAIDSLYEHLHGKTKVGSITFTLRYASGPQLVICYNPKFSTDWNDDKYQSFYGDDPQTILDDAAAWAQAMPTRAPLVEAMKRLSENIITKQE